MLNHAASATSWIKPGFGREVETIHSGVSSTGYRPVLSLVYRDFFKVDQERSNAVPRAYTE